VAEFRVALTGDFLHEKAGNPSVDIGLGLLDAEPRIIYRFVADHAPRREDPAWFSRLYSMEVKPEHIADVDGLVVLRPWVKQSTFKEGAASLTVIGRSGAGYDKIDIDACTRNDVAVFNCPLELNHSTASTALLFILALSKRLMEQDHITRTGRWDLQPATMGAELQGRTLGIIGLGHSGRELVRLIQPFQMRIVACSPHADPAQAAAMGVRLVSLEELLRASDFVSLHCRLTPQTRRLIGRSQLEMMNPSAYLINIARGELIDQSALVEALLQRRIAGAALDVFETEPLPAGDPLTRLDNVILTPHYSPATVDIWAATGRATSAGMIRAAHGRIPDNIVNPAVLDRPGFCAKLARFSEKNETALTR
jgi:phosphoglycerate dehydrogenase-like enzyme